MRSARQPARVDQHCLSRDRAVQEIFSAQVSGSYELVNHVLTFGLDVIWRRRGARFAAAGGGTAWADLCTGTGETAMYLRRLAPAGTRVFGVDFSQAMLREALKKRKAGVPGFAAADVKQLPFADETFDLLTISFATRNLNLSRAQLVATFAEFYRVLKPGGRFVNIETSQPPAAVVRRLFHGYIKRIVLPVGMRISGSRAGYAYLAHTMPRFYDAETLAEILHAARFGRVEYQHMCFGAAAIHCARKVPAD